MDTDIDVMPPTPVSYSCTSSEQMAVNGTAVIVRLVELGTAATNGQVKNRVAVPPELEMQGATHI